MPRQENDTYYCNICGKPYKRDTYAMACEQGHEYVYIPLSQSDLFRLIQFLYTKDESLLTETLVKTLLKYRRDI